MHIPYFMRSVNRTFTNPIMGRFAWIVPPLAVVHHVGRKSGRQHRTPVVAFRDGQGFVIPMTYGRDVDWARNLVKARGGEIDQMGRHFTIRNPRIVGFDLASARLPALVRPVLRLADFPGYVLADFAPAQRRGAAKSKRAR